MQTISTKYLPATNTKPSRVKATASGNSISVTVSGSDEEAHIRAVKMLKDKLGWPGKMVGGHTTDGMVFVFADDRYVVE